MKAGAHVWIYVNYLTKTTHRHTHIHTHKYTVSCDRLLARHSSTCLFLSIPLLSLAFCISFLIEHLVWKLQGQGSLFFQKVNISVGWPGTSSFTVYFQLDHVLSTSSNWGSRGADIWKSLYLVTSIMIWWRTHLALVPRRSPCFSQARTGGVFFVFWLCIFIDILDI